MKTKMKMMVWTSAMTLTGALLLWGLNARADETKAQVKAYPLKTCLVSGEKLGEMGEPYVFTNKLQEIKLCCKGCLKKFNKDEARYLKKLQAAEAKPKQP